MIGPILLIGIVFILKGISSFGGWALTIVEIISIPFGLWIAFTMAMDAFKNIPKTLSSPTHPNNPTGISPGETYDELWNQQKKRYVIIIGASLIVRGISLYLITTWFNWF